MNADTVRALVRAECDKAGGVRKLAGKIGLSPAYVSDVTLGRREPGPSILEVLGLEKVVVTTYRKVRA